MITRPIRNILESGKEGEKLSIPGWVRTVRDSKNVVFISLNDGSSITGLQLVVEKDSFSDLETLGKISVGSAIIAEGTLKKSQGQGQSI